MGLAQSTSAAFLCIQKPGVDLCNDLNCHWCSALILQSTYLTNIALTVTCAYDYGEAHAQFVQASGSPKECFFVSDRKTLFW